ncbi:MAG: regulatory protein RecX [Oscillospiraceae bacterium]|nr:regulatory protein RecX [Oscillospiraceae bacterium]
MIKTQDYVIADLGLFKGLSLDEDELRRLQAAVGLASAKNRAVRIAAASAVSKKELQRRLTQKGESSEDADAAVRWLSDLDLLDDRKTAEQLVRIAVNKGYGRTRIKQILFEKRIPQEYWEEALSLVPEMDDAVDQFLARRLKGREPDEKELKRTVDALMRRGHSWQDIRAGLRRYSATLDIDQEEGYE